MKQESGEQCRAPGCTARTRGEKPFCTDHVLQMDYAATVLARWERELVENAD